MKVGATFQELKIVKLEKPRNSWVDIKRSGKFITNTDFSGIFLCKKSTNHHNINF
jgi:hypothetical protein